MRFRARTRWSAKEALRPRLALRNIAEPKRIAGRSHSHLPARNNHVTVPISQAIDRAYIYNDEYLNKSGISEFIANSAYQGGVMQPIGWSRETNSELVS